jgi:hypothetical protein
VSDSRNDYELADGTAAGSALREALVAIDLLLIARDAKRLRVIADVAAECLDNVIVWQPKKLSELIALHGEGVISEGVLEVLVKRAETFEEAADETMARVTPKSVYSPDTRLGAVLKEWSECSDPDERRRIVERWTTSEES